MLQDPELLKGSVDSKVGIELPVQMRLTGSANKEGEGC